MRDCDFLVVGSGFGGSVSALRLAQKGYRVVVVEAGRRWRPDELPQSTWDLRRYNWLPSLGCHGLLRMELLRHALVLGGAGVGGGSLVYGNTLFTPTDAFFDDPRIRWLGGRVALEPWFDLARRMLGVVPNPRSFAPDVAMRQTAESYGRGHTFTPSPVGIHFGPPGERVDDPYFAGEGPSRSGCTFCGGCFVGCRHDAKNTLDRNYLWFAERLGAQVVPEHEVFDLKERHDGYEVLARRTTRRRREVQRFRARKVVFAAGVTGTLRLLLRLRDAGRLPGLSPTLGRHVHTNGETIVGVMARSREVDWSDGIAASSSAFPDDHTQVQADRYPEGSDALALLAVPMVDGGGRLPRPVRLLGRALRHPREAARFLNPFGAARRSVILVVMQDHEGSLRLVRRRGLLGERLDSQADQGPPPPSHIPLGNDFARRLAERLDATPFSTLPEVLLGVPVTAHILGGVRVAPGADEGVVDERHRVHGHPDLYVCDGSTITTNLGVNPALTITALAERAMSLVPRKPGAAFRHLEAERRWGVVELLDRG